MWIFNTCGNKTVFYVLLTLIMLLFMPPLMLTQAQEATTTPTSGEQAPAVPERVDIQPTAQDEAIARRLQDILSATGWFIDPQLRVQNGVVFLSGQAQTAEFKDWAGNLARNTQDVAAVVNQLEVVEPALLDVQPFVTGLRTQVRTLLRSLPLLGFSLIILILAWIAARFLTGTARRYFQSQQMNVLLLNVIARSIGIMVFLGGLYLVFQVAGWTSIALTILGGTGLFGLVLGIAFRDISENFLASIFLSIQNPFNIGDLVEINDVLGFVQRMTTRATILMTLAGNHVQIPNATVYKSIIHNYTSNPNRRLDFTIGIGYDDSISLAQDTVHQVLEAHPAVLNEPEHLVLVDRLGSATVNLQIYFWIDGSKHSWLKVKSSVIRLVKRAIEGAGISMPDEARELIFPQGVPVQMVPLDGDQDTPAVRQIEQPAQPHESETVSTSAEGGLRSEAEEIETQARQSRTPEAGENLLKTETSE
ncbi:MAG: mechanosensitive ion channel [Anaerolineae bacterium]|nr:mechanosensitive ion channel [Anaerolineae bacterium]